MPWVDFFAGRHDLLELLEFARAEAGCEILEGYSAFDSELRRFPDRASLESLHLLGAAPTGPQLVLWSPLVGPAPRVRRITLAPGAVPGHGFRYTAEGCALVTLLCGGEAPDAVLHASHLGWWTEASARAKAAPELGAADVRWRELAALGRRIKAHVRRRATATAGGRPILPEARALVQRGLRLRDSTAPTAELVIVAAGAGGQGAD